MRAFERQDGESSKAYAAFCVYRDLGVGRSLQKAAELYYGHTGNVRQFQRYSKKFDWVDRVAAWDDFREMIEREAVVEHERGRAQDYAGRLSRIREGMLENSELAVQQERKMLDWPLTKQRVVNEDEDVVYVFMPAGWNKGTAATMRALAAGAVTGSWSVPEDPDTAMNFDNLTDEEMAVLIELAEKMGTIRDGRR